MRTAIGKNATGIGDEFQKARRDDQIECSIEPDFGGIAQMLLDTRVVQGGNHAGRGIHSRHPGPGLMIAAGIESRPAAEIKHPRIYRRAGKQFDHGRLAATLPCPRAATG